MDLLLSEPCGARSWCSSPVVSLITAMATIEGVRRGSFCFIALPFTRQHPAQGAAVPAAGGSAPCACAVLLFLLRDAKPRCAYAWSKCGSHNSCAGIWLFLAGSCLLMAAAGTQSLCHYQRISPSFSSFLSVSVCVLPCLATHHWHAPFAGAQPVVCWAWRQQDEPPEQAG